MISKKVGSRLVSLLLAVLMLIAYMPLLGETAYADDGDEIVYTNVSDSAVADMPNTYGVTIATDKKIYAPGDDIYVKVTGTSNMTGAEPWIGLFDNTGASSSHYWAYTSGDFEGFIINNPEKNPAVTKQHDITAPQKYYIIMNDTEGRWAGLEIIIVENPSTLSTDKTRYKVGEPIMVSCSSDYENAWVGFYDYLRPNGDNVDLESDLKSYFYVSDANGAPVDVLHGDVVADKEKVADLPVGKYKVVLFSSGYAIDDTNGGLWIKSFTIEHSFGDPEFDWYKDGDTWKASATFTAVDDATITKEVQPVITSEVTPATCEAAGKTVYTATIAADQIDFLTESEAPFTDTKTVEIPKKDHTPGEAVEENKVDSTCTAEGSYDEVVYCTECKAEISRTTKKIEKKAHTEEVIPAKEATCTETGLTEGKKCSVCGEVLVAQEEVPKKDHTPGEAVREDGADASCEEAGFHFDVVKCTACGEEISRTKVEDPALGHDYQVVEGSAKAATFTEAGKEADQKCSRCGDVKAGAEIPMLVGDAKLSKTKFHYNGKTQKPAVTVTVNGEELAADYYDVSIPSSKKIGTYKVTVKTKGDYAGFEKILSYQIAPKKVALKSVAKGTKSFTAKWAKQSKTAQKNIDGFQIRYSKSKDFKSGVRTVKVSKKLASKTVKKLTKKKKYYVQIRTYKKVSGKTYYSDWSASKYVTTK